MSRKKRINLILQPDHYERLLKIAHDGNNNLAGLVRKVVAEWLESRQKWDQTQKALYELTEFRLQMEAKHGIFPEDLITEARAERDQEIARACRGKE